MALNDDALLNIGEGHFYLADVGTAAPADLSTIDDATWTDIGHTSADNVFGMTSDGGDVTVLQTLQSSSVRTSTAPVVETFNISLDQFDVDALKLYFGANAVAASGWLAVQDNIVPTKKAFLAVFADGESRFGIWAASTEIQRSDAPEFAARGSLSSLPIGVKPLNYNGATSKYSVTPIETVS